MFFQNFQSGPKESLLIQYGGRMWVPLMRLTDRIEVIGLL